MDRLEALVNRLEAYASSLPNIHTIIDKQSNGNKNNVEEWAALKEYRHVQQTDIQAFLKATQTTLPHIAKLAQEAFDRTGVVLEAVRQCQKPSDEELMEFAQPIVKAMEQASAIAEKRSAHFNQEQAFAEAVQALAFIMSPQPKETIMNALEAADFYLNRVLLEAKKASGQEAHNMTDFVGTLKKSLMEIANIANEHFKLGLQWNAKGVELSKFSAGAESSSGTSTKSLPQAPPVAPTLSASIDKPNTSGMGAVFAELSNSNGAFKLNKVTGDMKTKNRKDGDIPAVKHKLSPESKVAVPQVTTTAKVAATRLVKGTHFVEYYNGDAVVKLENVELKENVYILGCKYTTVEIDSKCKSITVEGCKRVQVIFKSVVSIFEIINCQNIKLQCIDVVPTVQIDKSSGVQIFLSRQSVAAVPSIITSNVSELNLIVPGKTDDDDPMEIPLPEQYITRYVNGRLVTEAVSHSSSS